MSIPIIVPYSFMPPDPPGPHGVENRQGKKTKKKQVFRLASFLEVTPGFEPGNESFADSCLTTWLCHHGVYLYDMRLFEKVNICFYEKTHRILWVFSTGAGNEARTRYLHLGKVALYQMSYARVNSSYNTRGYLICQHLFQTFLKIFSAVFSVSDAGSSWRKSSGAGASSRNSTRPTSPSWG